MLHNVEDIKDFDAMLKRRIKGFQEKLRDWLVPHRLTVAEIRRHLILMPMVGFTRRVGRRCRPVPGNS